MDIAIERFIRYLNNRKENVINRTVEEGIATAKMGKAHNLYGKELRVGRINLVKINDELTVIDNFIKLLSIPPENWEEQREIFGDFALLSDYLIDSPLRVQDRFKIITYFIKKNVVSGVLKDDLMLFDTNNECGLDPEDKLFINSPEFQKLLKKDNTELTIVEIERRDYLVDVLFSNLLDTSEIHTQYTEIMEHYLSKEDTYNAEDLSIFIEVLSSLGVKDDLLNQIRMYLSKRMNKRKTVEEYRTENSSVKYTPSATKKKYVTDAEYRAIKKEISKYFDIHNGKLVRPLTDEEVYYCASLMARISCDESDISTLFMRYYQQDSMCEMNLFAKYGYFYEKLQYYAEKKGYQSDLTFINDCIKEMMMAREDEYSFWKSNFIFEARMVLSQLPSNYNFEIEKAKKLIK